MKNKAIGTDEVETLARDIRLDINEGIATEKKGDTRSLSLSGYQSALVGTALQRPLA